MSQLEQIPPADEPAEAVNASRLSNIGQIVIGLLAVVCFIVFYPGAAKTTALFLAILGVLVFVHELGHYQFARWAGMKVNRFALGFPPFIYTVRKNNIDYSIGALPIGGMVDIAGLGSEEEMVTTSRENVEHLLDRTNIGAATDEKSARQEISRNSSRAFGERQFQEGSVFWRFMVLFAGPLMNFLLAIVIFVGIFTIVGMPKKHAIPFINTVMAGQAADKGGLKAKDEIVSIRGIATHSSEEVVNIIRNGPATAIPMVVSRGGKTVNLSVTPVVKDQGSGLVPSIGVEIGERVLSITYTKLTPLVAIKEGVNSSLEISKGILDTIKRAATRKLSSEEVKSIGGPVKIAQTVGEASTYGPIVLFNFAAMLSVNLGLMNLLPLPALDGGRIMFVLYEIVARRPFNPRWESAAHAAGMLMLLTFMAFITLRDLNAGALLQHFIR